MKYKQVIFLDIDGVMNTSQSLLLQNWEDPKKMTDKKWCPLACSHLRLILESCPDVKIILSSAWRCFYKINKMKYILKKNGLEAGRLKDYTPQERPTEFVDRGILIQRWLDEHPEVEEFVIIDDNSDMAHLKDKLFQTDSRIGLTLPIALDIIEVFTGKKPNIWSVSRTGE